MRARDNPFSTDRVLQVRYRPLGTTWPALLQRLHALSYRAAIVGPKGTGKTTLLEDIQPHLEQKGFEIRHLRLDLSKPRFINGELFRAFQGLGNRHIILLDGASHLSWLRWRLFRRRCATAGGLIITSHRPGLLPTLIDCHTTPALLQDIVQQLLGTRPDDPRLSLEALFTRHHGNIREVLRTLYDHYADCNQPRT